MMFIFLIAAPTVLHFGFVITMVLVAHQLILWLWLNRACTVSRPSLFFPTVPLASMSRLEVGKKVGGDTAGQLAQIGQRDILCHITSCSAMINGIEEEEGFSLPRWPFLRDQLGMPLLVGRRSITFASLVLLFPHHHPFLHLPKCAYLDSRFLTFSLPIFSPVPLGQASSCVGTWLLAELSGLYLVTSKSFWRLKYL